MALAIAACGGQATSADEAGASESAAAEATSTTVAPQTTTTQMSTSTTSTVPQTTTSVSIDKDNVVPLASVVGGTIRGEGWLVEPGRYTTEMGNRVFTFTIPKPVVYFDSDVRITFGPDTSSDVPDLFALTEFVGVIPPELVGEHAPHDPVIPTYSIPVPESLGTWLTSVPQLSTGNEIELTTETGFGGSAWDVEVSDPSIGTFHCSFGDCIGSLVQESEGVWVLFDAARFRLWQMSGEAAGLYGFLQSRPDTFTDMVSLAETILSDIEISTTG